MCISLLFSSWGENNINRKDGISNNLKFISPYKGELSIVASTPIPPGITPTKEAFNDLIECGFNVGMENGGIEYFRHIFSLINDLNFKYLIANADLFNDKRINFVNAFSKNKNFAGWNFTDEPVYDNLKNLKKEYYELYELDPNTLIFINLVGDHIKKFVGDTKNFNDYLDLIQETFRPAVWSYDLYPIYIKNGKINVSYDIFYSDFEMFSEISKKTKRPFWAYCQSMAFKNSIIERPAAKEEYLRFEAFSALAYGAQGIVYWTYGQRKSNSMETYTSALVNLDGKKTKAWYAAKKVNAEIKKFNGVFYECDVIKVRHTGQKLYKDTKRLTGDFGPFYKVQTGDAGVLLSHIMSKTGEYVVIVNHDVKKSQRISLYLKNDFEVTELTSHIGKGKKTFGKIEFNLPKGDWAIFQIK